MHNVKSSLENYRYFKEKVEKSLKYMITVIKKGASAKAVKQKLEKHTKAAKKDDLRKYCGVISLKKDPVELQKEWRNEWK